MILQVSQDYLSKKWLNYLIQLDFTRDYFKRTEMSVILL